MTTFERIRSRLLVAPVQGMFLTDEERSHLDEEIDEVLASIARKMTMIDAERELQELGIMEETLATLCFKYQLGLSEKQRNLIRQYDRWDVFEVRATTYEAIRQGKFL
jgi:hypothetical protein